MATAENRIGQMVVIDEHDGGRQVVTYTPMLVNDDGTLYRFKWTNVHGDKFTLDKVNASNPEILIYGSHVIPTVSVRTLTVDAES